MDRSKTRVTVGPGWDQLTPIIWTFFTMIDELQQMHGYGEVVLKCIDARNGLFYVEWENIHESYFPIVNPFYQGIRTISVSRCEICGERSIRRKFFTWIPTLCRDHFIDLANYADDRRRAILSGEYVSPQEMSPLY